MSQEFVVVESQSSMVICEHEDVYEMQSVMKEEAAKESPRPANLRIQLKTTCHLVGRTTPWSDTRGCLLQTTRMHH